MITVHESGATQIEYSNIDDALTKIKEILAQQEDAAPGTVDKKVVCVIPFMYISKT